MSSEIGRMSVTVTANTRDMVDKIQNDGDAAGRSLGKKIAGGLAGAAAGIGLAAAGIGAVVAKQSIDAASNLNETSSKIQQIFGAEAAKSIQSWSDTASTAFGQSKQQAMDAAATFATFGKAAGMSGGELTGFSTQMTTLASDLASFHNTKPEEAITAIGAALRGEMEPIRKYGVLMDDASLKQAIFEKTGQKVTGTLTPQQKVLAAQALIMKQTSDAQGDFARTSGGLANSQRTLAATIEDVKGQIGQGLLPAVTEIVKAVGPILKDVAPMLGQLATVVGKNLADAFKAIQPLLPTLVDALGKIASSVGGGLISAIAALIPAITPVIAILGELGARIGPLVSEILNKVAGLLTKLLGAVTPLLQPLIDLVFTVLDAAWPIIQVVADVVGILIDALAPLLNVVGALLKPIGDLISIGFKALLPVIKPLTPLIAALAAVLADVLGRAIGLIITALGYLIIGASKVAPFLLNNLVKPVVSAFLTFAESVVGSAEAAFSWVPGLGDKLTTAKKAIGDFKSNATKGISDAAAMIERDGGKIGQTMVDQGLAAVKDPANVGKTKEAGKAIGYQAGAGMIAGMQAQQSSVYQAGADLGTAATKGAKETLQVRSPSRVFAEIGGNVVQGFEIGLSGLDKVSDKIRASLDKAVQASNDRLQKFVDGVRSKMDDAISAFKDYQQASMNFLSGGQKIGDAWRLSTDSQDKAAQTFKDLEKAKADLAKVKPGEDTSSQTQAVADAQQAYDAAKAAIVSFETAWNQQLAQSNIARDLMATISSQVGATQGGQMLMQQLFSMDQATAISIGRELIGVDGNPTTLLGSMSASLAEQNVWNSSAATAMAQTAKGAGIDQAAAAVNGISKKVKAEQERIQGIGADIGNGMVIGFKGKQGAFRDAVDSYIAEAKKALGIKSPSRVFAEIGSYTAQGFNQGLQGSLEPFTPNAQVETLGSLVSGRAEAQIDMSSVQAAPEVRVFIGDRELTDIVDVQIAQAESHSRDLVIAGRRY